MDNKYDVYVVTRPIEGGWDALLAVCEQVLQSGVKFLQLRNKSASDEVLLEHALTLRALAEHYGAHLIVNDHVHLARFIEAHGVHLGQDDMPVEKARRLLGENAIIGVSVRTPEEARAAELGGATYLAASLVYPSVTKTDVGGPPLGLEGVRRLRAVTNLPLLAIGGIKLHNAAEIVAAGADGVAVISEIIAATDVPAACQGLFEAVARGKASRRKW